MIMIIALMRFPVAIGNDSQACGQFQAGWPSCYSEKSKECDGDARPAVKAGRTVVRIPVYCI